MGRNSKVQSKKSGKKFAQTQPPRVSGAERAKVLVRRKTVVANGEVRPTHEMKWFNSSRLALKCGVTPQTIRNEISRGHLAARQTRSGRYVISRVEADRYMVENGFAAF
jgi:hypothetical protein